MLPKIFSKSSRLVFKQLQRSGYVSLSRLARFSKYVYDFEQGNAGMRYELGGKGANLCEMVNLGIPVPPGFVISVEACKQYEKYGRMPKKIRKEYGRHLKLLEKKMGKKLGDDKDPLLVSVRSGAAISMPGMMDTVLNLGLNDRSVKGLIKKTKNKRFALDSYRRFIQMFGDVVMDIPGQEFEDILTEIKETNHVDSDDKLEVTHLNELITEFKSLYKKRIGENFPQNINKQLSMAINAVFNSWNNNRAIAYRKINNIPREISGTAVNVQSMVYGNKGDTSGTGVCFSRDPSNGENKFYGEYLMNAQGEDVVAGVRTPLEISTLKELNPRLYKELVDIKNLLEVHYKDV